MSRLLLCFFLMAAATERQVVFPGSAKPVGPYSPGIFAGDYLYVSGQGARDPQNKLPATEEGQVRQCLENVKTIVEAAGLTMDNVVYTHAYLADMTHYGAMNKVYSTYFPKLLPARSTIGVARMPTGTPVEISAIAVRDASTRRAVRLPNTQAPVPISPGILTNDRFFLSGILGRDSGKNVTPKSGEAQMQLCIERVRRVLGAAGISTNQLVHLNVYRTAGLPRDRVAAAIRRSFPETAISLIEASGLPFDVNIGITGVAVRDARQKRVYKVAGETLCATAAETVYCAAQAGDDVTLAARKIQAGLQQLGTGLSRAVYNNVYLANIDDFAKMNAAYAQSFPAPHPSRTTVQPAAAGGPAVQLSVVAVR